VLLADCSSHGHCESPKGTSRAQAKPTRDINGKKEIVTRAETFVLFGANVMLKLT
jgi:hypothetical protein